MSEETPLEDLVQPVLDSHTVAKLTDAMQALIAAIKTTALFGEKHTNTVKSTGNLCQRFRALLESSGIIRLDFGPHGATIGEIPVLEVDRPQDSPFYGLLTDGIGGLTFHPDADDQQLAALVAALATPAQERMEDSAGTVLWDADLPHIGLIHLPALMGRDFRDDDTPDEFEDLVANALAEQADPDEPVVAWQSSLRADELNISDLEELANAQDPNATVHRTEVNWAESEHMQAFRNGLAEPPGGSESTFAKALLMCAESTATAEELDSLFATLSGLTLSLMERGDFEHASVLIHHCNATREKLSRPRTLTPAYAESFARALRTGLAQRPNLKNDPIRRLWVGIPDQLHQAILQNAVEETDVGLVRRFRHLFTKMGPETTKYLQNTATKAAAEIAPDLLLLTAQVLGNNAIDMVRQTLAHQHPQLRKLAFRILAHLNAQEAAVVALRLIRDEDHWVRQDALVLLAKRADPTTLDAVKQAIVAPEFQMLGKDEKRDLFVCAGTVDRTGGLGLVRTFAEKSDLLQRRHQLETQVAAVEALRFLDPEGSVDFLSKLGSHWRTASDVKTACKGQAH